eukprot:356174-Chlamydomonas_euryale.AAC.17
MLQMQPVRPLLDRTHPGWPPQPQTRSFRSVTVSALLEFPAPMCALDATLPAHARDARNRRRCVGRTRTPAAG